MDNGSIGSFGHHLCMAAFSPAVILHQAKVDLKGRVWRAVEDQAMYDIGIKIGDGVGLAIT